ncbi:hypothetical protein HRbin30_01260 [bacterium HR30]|nr:hypothetical protein HRbin30_01260 [bacterium HR30]
MRAPRAKPNHNVRSANGKAMSRRRITTEAEKPSTIGGGRIHTAARATVPSPTADQTTTRPGSSLWRNAQRVTTRTDTATTVAQPNALQLGYGTK